VERGGYTGFRLLFLNGGGDGVCMLTPDGPFNGPELFFFFLASRSNANLVLKKINQITPTSGRALLMLHSTTVLSS